MGEKRENPIRRLCGLWARARGFRAAERGGVALLTALALPPILLVSMGAIQLQSVFSDKNKSQNIADAAALWGAQQLTVTPVGVAERAKAFAEGVSQTPLCVLTFGVNATDHKMQIHGGSRMTAPACLIHANERIEVDGTAQVSANTVETGASASGPITPTASTGAPDVDDPFATLNVPNPGLLCPIVGLLTPFVVFDSQTRTLPAGCHGKVEVKNGGTLILEAGEHIFTQDFELKNMARVSGEDVVLVFASGADARWKDGASITLGGRQSGALAGFVIVTARSRTNEFKLETNAIDELTGTIYVPNAELTLEGDSTAGQESDWTVMAAQKLHLHGNPVVQINANYSGSDVPVPVGVGNKSKATFTHLKQ